MAEKQLYYTFEDKKYPIFTTIGSNGTLTQVKGIPLKCPTCPNVPRFKDISHLITHYGSRDHLKAANETKIRHDLGIPESVRVYTLYQLWESHNHLWRWLIESHRRKNKLNEIKREDEDFPEYQPAVNPHPEDLRMESPANNILPSLEIQSVKQPLPIVPMTVEQAPAPISQTPLTVKPAPGRRKKSPTQVEESENFNDSELAFSNDQTPAQGQKRPRGRPRKYPPGTKPVRRSMPNRRSKAPSKIIPEPVAEPANSPSNNFTLDTDIEFPVDPLAPKAKPLRVRRAKRDNSGTQVDEVHRSSPTLKGKKYPGMAVYDFGNLPNLENGVNILITAADQQTLPFDIDGHILRFGDDEDDSLWVETLEELDERPSKRNKKDESDESFNLSTSTENDEYSNESANISASTENSEGYNESMNASAGTDGNEESTESQHYLTTFNNGSKNNDGGTGKVDGNKQQLSFTIFEDDGGNNHHGNISMDNTEPTLASTSSKRHPLQELPHYTGAEEIYGIDLCQQNPFGQLSTQPSVQTFSNPTMPRHRTIRTYEGLSAHGTSLGWQGSFAPSSSQQ